MRPPRYGARGSAVLFIALLLAGCLDVTGSSLDGPRNAVTAITVQPGRASVHSGKHLSLSAILLDAQGRSVTGQTVRWSSADTMVATVSDSGVVTARDTGSTVIAAAAGTLSAVSALTVVPPAVASLALAPDTATVATGTTVQLTATPRDDAGSALAGRTVTWLSADSTIARVSSSGVVAGIRVGRTTVTAQCEGNTATATITVALPLVATVSVDPASLALVSGAQHPLVATLHDARGGIITGRTVTWKSSDTAVATVTAAGLVQARAAGRTTITAASEGKNATSTIVVSAPAVASVVVAPSTASVPVGGRVTLAGTARDASGTAISGPTFAWSTTASSVATVTSAGVVTGVTTGTATIIATAGGHADSALVTVAPPAVASVSVSPASDTLQAGGTQQLAVTVRGANGATVSGATVTWSTSDAAVARVSPSGLATAVGAGSATISASAGGKSGGAVITVPSAAVVHAGYYVSPGGTSGGDGTVGRPWDLATALAGGGGRVQPGDTVWLRGGTYGQGDNVSHFTSTLTGTPATPIIVRQYPGERATLDGALTVAGGYTWFWGFEVANTTPGPQSINGLSVAGPGTKCIDLVIHDHTGNGIFLAESAPDAEVYGSLLYNNGLLGSTPTSRAHGIYAQNRTGTKLLQDDIIFQSFGYGFHIYGESGALNNFTLDGDVAFDNGLYDGFNYVIGGLQPVVGLTLTHSLSYGPNATGHLGYPDGPVSTGAVVTDNYFVGPLYVENWGSLTFRRNTIVQPLPWEMVFLKVPTRAVLGAYNWDANTYVRLDPTGQPFNLQTTATQPATSIDYPWASWPQQGLDGTSRYAAGRPSRDTVFLRANRYVPGRANLVVYNWTGAASVPVDLSGVLRVGAHYTVQPVEAYYGAPVAQGTYEGGAVTIPLPTMAPPVPLSGWPKAPLSPTSTFHAFVVRSTP